MNGGTRKKSFVLFLALLVIAFFQQVAFGGSIIGWGSQVVGGDLSGGFAKVAAGGAHSLGLKQDGSIVAWGWNGDGQCNIPSPNSGFIAIAAGGDDSLALRAEAPEEILEYAAETIATLDPECLHNKNASNALINKIEAVLSMIDEGLYQDALDKLRNDILQKTDGCANTGQPDKNDWILTCEDQEKVYPLVVRAIELLQRLLE